MRTADHFRKKGKLPDEADVVQGELFALTTESVCCLGEKILDSPIGGALRKINMHCSWHH